MKRFDVTIAGELNLDLILYGLPAELSPERELLADDMALTLGSSSAIVAHNLACLGNKVGFQSLIGDDSLGKIALERLARSGVDTSGVQTTKIIGTGLSVILQRGSYRNILTYSGAISKLSLGDLDLDYLCDARHFHLSSYYLQANLRPGVLELFRRLKAAGVRISLDTNDDPEGRFGEDLLRILEFVDVFLPNQREACKIAGTEDVNAAMEKLSTLVPLLVVKRGPQGAVAIRDHQKYDSPALKVAMVDPVGAGDSFDAGFIHAYLGGKSLGDCLAAGNAAGALCATRAGGTEAFADRAYREAFFKEHALPV
ncbi:MAG TPA: sugar kinase [Terriglobales bacterium]|nr:sugar kinase [Terriglobales bacterium]